MSETWYIKGTAPVDAASQSLPTTTISFTTATKERGTTIGIESTSSTSRTFVYGGIGGVASFNENVYPYFDWKRIGYRILTFDTAPSGELLAWLKRNATKRASAIDTLVTDRTQADVERVNELAAKGYAGMTAAELAEWLAGMKGAYNAADLNRVGTALNYLKDRLAPLCGRDIQWTAKKDWAVTDVITASQAAVYRAQVQDIRDALTYPADAPDVPELSRLTYTCANDIERILTLCETLIDNVIMANRYTGAAECAVGGLIT